MSLSWKKSDTKPEHRLAGQVYPKPGPHFGTTPLAAGTKQEKWTDTKEILSPGLMIAYRARSGGGYPTKAQKSMLINAASSARTIMRKAVREMDRVVFFRRKEGRDFSNIMNYHFGLATGRSTGLPSSNVVDKSFQTRDLGQTDRRWALNKVREGMLSISFHLNTGMYLIDIDNANRTFKSGMAGTSNANEEGYASWATWGGLHKGILSGWKNGEIHLAFEMMENDGYSDRHIARVIIHEAAHKYLGVTDVLYAHQGGYDALPFERAIDNADSFAWAALSLEEEGLIEGADSQDDVVVAGPIAPQAQPKA